MALAVDINQAGVEVGHTVIPEAGLFVLPGGYVADDGVVHREVELAPLTGMEEEWLAQVPPYASAAGVVTGLLSRSVRRVGSLAPVSPTLIRGLLVGDREYLMVKLRQMTLGPRVAAVCRCASAGCGRPMDITFSLANLAFERQEVTTRFFTRRLALPVSVAGGPSGEGRVEFRLPTGADQESLAPFAAADEAAAVNRLLARCVRRLGRLALVDEGAISRLPDTVRGEIAAEIERLSPQVAIELELTCPDCKAASATAVDFTALFLREILGGVRGLEQEVHFLAWHYHWSEREILSLSHGKRRRYVTLAQEEAERLQ